MPATKSITARTSSAAESLALAPADSVGDASQAIGESAWREKYLPIALTIGAHLGMFLLNAIQGVILARLMTPEHRGEYATVMFYPLLLLLYLGMLGTNFSIARRAAQAPGAMLDLQRASLRVGLITGALTISVVAILAVITFAGEERYLIPLAIAAALLVPTEHIRLALLAVNHGRGDFRRYNAHRLLGAAIYPLLLVAAGLTLGISLQLAVTLAVAAPCVALAARLWQCRGQSVFARAETPPTTLIREGLHYAPACAAQDVFNRFDFLLVLQLTACTAAGLHTRGLYAVAVPAASLLNVAANALSLFSFNVGANPAHRLSRRRLLGIAGGLMAFQTITALSFGLLVPWLIVMVYGEPFREAAAFTLALLPAQACFGCSMVVEGYLRGRGLAQHGVWARVIGTIITLNVVALGFETHGVIIIPWAAGAGHAVVALWMMIAALRDVDRQARADHVALATQRAEYEHQADAAAELER